MVPVDFALAYDPVSLLDFAAGNVTTKLFTTEVVPVFHVSLNLPVRVRPLDKSEEQDAVAVPVPDHVPLVGSPGELFPPEGVQLLSVPEKVTVCFTGLPDTESPGFNVPPPLPWQTNELTGAAGDAFAAEANPPVKATVDNDVKTITATTPPTPTTLDRAYETMLLVPPI
jgi:hypothetical protein